MAHSNCVCYCTGAIYEMDQSAEAYPHTRMCNPIRESESQSLHKRNPIFISRYFVFLLCMNRSSTQLAQAFDLLDMEGTRD